MDLRSVHPGLLFTVGLANVWEYPDCRVVFKDIVGDDKKILATKEKKKLQAAKAKAKKKKSKRADEDGESSQPKPKRRKFKVVRKEQPTSSGGATSPTPINTVALVSNSEQKGDSSTEVEEVHGLFRRPSQNSTPEMVQE
ncbi:hypothetical protein Tco_0707608 [Tanacetum coccineum]|uniref:Uncharacterized protein n=1 Tax=Tanacetum coccineum TaxID=301880 RepID=A0ABQ4YC91_9ASTR